MKGEIKLKILEFLEGSAQFVDDMLFVFSLPHGTSYSKMEYFLEKRREQADKIVPKQIRKQTRQCFNVFFYRLKKDGLVEKKNKNKKSLLKLTPKGREILQKLRSTILPNNKYKSQSNDTLKIVIFDIPEREREKRDWLRIALKNLNFNMVQKSVWIGKAKLPKEFVQDLNRMNIFTYVEIFAVTKAGSLRSLKVTQ
ncbi:MAG: hypothetical protein AUJ32_00885 [Parcubacteria group bacterium CG1_02_40_82]|uniref:Transcriptional repressor PaaX-like central Cas2-like domain-containing protein n=4 Tax=Candidatus Portnoyibacteriota TaxID=1817913 RepID=A0A2M7IH41_9BACT|nr:MAG: hypothetical protein AUJ32_00885 [Parcubacteria group bacterium CG1_02_40_82]PIQ75123.1 MAG: hypothetical protein COV84_02920 [Candidatus Portnoybacteria bacterium CG11_big_fil_rev_8_21_14_0_20_40_15]PIS31558.1 MAG: hypothetical protein COT41_01395 [Candidatus Portnoybacteria bacterium CG08_land_8_20_14_0_20_40_83]PIW75856.1 MAG: hypothetical protein CO001_04490 [Candidatus Portnoybacteria bacterium CG_4_8_14_3_um_filter_40_10]PIY74909.1 MAG: hypothetical protein COY85_01845 [Candidatus